MYTLEELQQKTFKELKEIGWQINVLPAGDRRCRQNWIDALVGVNPPLLQLLEASPGVEVEPVQEAIEIQHQEAIEIQAQEPIEVQRLEPIAPDTETHPGVSFDVEEFVRTHEAEIESYFKSFTEADRPPNRGDNGRGRIESEPKVSKSAIGCDDSPAVTGITFSPRFLATYPPYFGEIRYKAEATGQLNFLELETTDEPPDPDDFDGNMFAFWAAYDAWCERTDDDSEQFEPLEISLTSMCEWAPCPLEWYEPAETIETIETVSCTLEISPVSVESSSTCNFSIPTFDAWCDRPNGKDEPPTASVGARLPKPKPPSFPPMVVAAGDRTNGKKFARSAILLSGRAPPGGDAM